MSAKHIGRETEVEALGQTWRLSRLTRALWEDWLAWARPRIPNPLAAVRQDLANWPEEDREMLVKAALDSYSAVLTINSKQARDMLSTIEGSTKMVQLLLRQHHPNMTEEKALEIMMELGQQKMNEAMTRAAGEGPKN
jgi:hypothetical protein